VAMDVDKLARELHSAQGVPGAPTMEVRGMAEAIISEVKELAIVSLLPGTIIATAPPSGGSLIGGSAGPGLIVGPSGPTLAARMVAKMGKGGLTPQMLGWATGVTTHLLTGTVRFSSGMITGSSANTPVSPGPAVGGGSRGKIVGLSPGGMAQLVVLGIGQTQVTDTVRKMCEAIVNHLMNDAEVAFTMGTLLGAASSGGGPVQAMGGSGGKIS
jgi:hypothetical protein